MATTVIVLWLCKDGSHKAVVLRPMARRLYEVSLIFGEA